MPEHFDIKTWIKEYFNLTPNDKTFEETSNSLEFLWVWSIFEHKYLKDSRANKSYNEQLVDLAEKYPKNQIDINTIYGFLYQRYFPHNSLTRFYNNLKFEKKWHNLSKAILNKNNPTHTEKLTFILLVLYKFRCNLFHGRKDPLLWKNFDKVFYHFNKFLAELLDNNWSE